MVSSGYQGWSPWRTCICETVDRLLHCVVSPAYSFFDFDPCLFFELFNLEWAKFSQLWFCTVNSSWPSINFHPSFFPSMKNTWLMASHKQSLWYACSFKDCGNKVSRLRDLSSVSSAVWSVRVPSWSPSQGVWHDTIRVWCARKSPFETCSLISLGSRISLNCNCSWLDFWLHALITILVSLESVEFFGWNRALTLRFKISLIQEYLSFEKQIQEYLFWKQIQEYLSDSTKVFPLWPGLSQEPTRFCARLSQVPH